MHPSIPRNSPIDPDIDRAVHVHGSRQTELLSILQTLHDAGGDVTGAAAVQVARALKLPAHAVYGPATFYSLLADVPRGKQVVRLCDGIVCWLHGSEELRRRLEQRAVDTGEVVVVRNSCLGLCERAPAALIDGHPHGPVDMDSLSSSKGLGAETAGQPFSIPARPGEIRVLLERAGRIDPHSIDEALQAGAYLGLQRALSLKREEVIAEIAEAGLRGRGGAGFSTARKWTFVSQAAGQPIVICNADESEPLMFKDRALIDADPHAVIEGLAIAGYAVGAKEGIIYIRGEYEPQAQLLDESIRRACAAGWLGEGILGSGFSFEIKVHRGGGAYICGEETALLESLEGKRGEPRTRPPYPAQCGYLGRPTAVNNVETLAVAAAILRLGSETFQTIGASETPGTRLLTLLGHINNPGLVEVPYGLTLRQLRDDFAGGMKAGSKFRFALTGGAAGTFVDERHLDIPLDYSCTKHGITMGSGGFLFCDDSVSPVAVLRELMHFFEVESCGKCTPCRIGTSQARQILDQILSGQGAQQDLQMLESLRGTLQLSLCGLGTSVPCPLGTAMDLFRQDFEELLK